MPLPLDVYFVDIKSIVARGIKLRRRLRPCSFLSLPSSFCSSLQYLSEIENLSVSVIYFRPNFQVDFFKQ
jgi:hypothetical protein